MNSNGPIKTVEGLARAGLLARRDRDALADVAARYAIALTPTVAGLIDRADDSDPIARQFVPEPAELITTPEERADPIGDEAHSPVQGIVHRYPDRLLLKAESGLRGRTVNSVLSEIIVATAVEEVPAPADASS